MTSDSDKTDMRKTSQITWGTPSHAGNEVGKRKSQGYANGRRKACNKKGKQQGAPKKRCVEVLIVRELKTGDVKAAGLTVKKTDGHHDAEGYDEKYPQHQRRIGQWQVCAYAFWFFTGHDFSTMQEAAGRIALALSPCLTSGRSLGVD